jgi:hypothetical protein
MARVTVTEYECEHDLLPAVCVKCGAPADDSLVRTFRIIDGSGQWEIWRGFAFLYALLFVPPLLPWALRLSRTFRINVPMCSADRAKESRREKRACWILVPIWIAWSIAVDAFLVVQSVTGGPGLLCFALVGFPFFFAALEVVTRPVRPKGERPANRGLPLTAVHPAFVAALVEDRARDRVANPDRRSLRGDMRDDFDDEPV